MGWSPEARQKVYELWMKGYSASQIAPRFNVTRNAIIGVIHRAGWNRGVVHRPRPKPGPGSNGGKPKARPVPGQHVAHQMMHRIKDRTTGSRVCGEAVPALHSRPCTIDKLAPGRCRFPLWNHEVTPNGIDDRYCGASADGTYCEHHELMCWNGTSSKETQQREALRAKLEHKVRESR